MVLGRYLIIFFTKEKKKKKKKKKKKNFRTMITCNDWAFDVFLVDNHGYKL
jgi:hypothetical protein